MVAPVEDMSGMLQAALDLADLLGFATFPVARDCRAPLTEHGVKDASKDPEVLAGWFARWPWANIAVACGAPSGVFVLDVDRKGADGFASLEAMQARFGPLPATLRAQTPSGGQHIYFRQPRRVLRNRVGSLRIGEDGERFPGLDVRSDGGSAAVAPSAKPAGPYAWLTPPWDCEIATAPAWLLDLIDPPAPPPRRVEPLRMNSRDRAARYVEAAVNRECGDLARMGPNTGRNLKLFQAAANLGELVAANLLRQDLAEHALEQAAAECGLTQEDGPHAIRATIKSGIRKGLTQPREVRA